MKFNDARLSYFYAKKIFIFRIGYLTNKKLQVSLFVIFLNLLGSEKAAASTLNLSVYPSLSNIIYSIECLTETAWGSCSIEQKVDGEWVFVSQIYNNTSESKGVVIDAYGTYEFRLLTYSGEYPDPGEGGFNIWLSETDLATFDYVPSPTLYEYDALGRLVYVTRKGNVITNYKYDKAGNRLEKKTTN